MPGAHSPSEDRGDDRAVPVNPVFASEPVDIPRFRIPGTGMHPEVAYQVVHDELMLDGNARLNLATFVTTWAEPQAERLLAESFDKNMIDKDEYPRTAAWSSGACGCSSTCGTPPTRDGPWAARRRGRRRRACSAGWRSSGAGSTGGRRRVSRRTGRTS